MIKFMICWDFHGYNQENIWKRLVLQLDLNLSEAMFFFPAKILIMADKDEDGEATFQAWEVSTSHGGFTMAKPWLNSRKKWGFPLVFSMEHGSSAEFKCRD